METITIGCITYTQSQAIAIMRHSTAQDKTYLLAQEVIAALLNINCQGSNSSCISADLAAAQNWLCMHPVGSGVPSGAVWNQIKATHARLEKYNEGKLCAPACDSNR